MALKTFVTATNAIFTVADNSSQIIGGGGNQTVRIQKTVTGASGFATTLDANIENIELSGALSSYKFKIDETNGFEIYESNGSTLVATIASINSANATLKFTGGSATLTQTGSNAFALGNAVALVADAGAVALSPTLTTGVGNVSTVTYDANGTAVTKANTGVSKAFVTEANDIFTVADHDVKVLAGADSQTVRIQAGVTGVTLDANIERIELSAALATYKFLATTNIGLRIYESNGTTLVATIPNINQNVEVAFTDGSTSLVQGGATAFTLGGQAVHVGAYVSASTPTTPAATLDRTAGEHSELGLIVTDATGADTNIGNVFTAYGATSGTSGTVATVVATDMMDNTKVQKLADNAAKIAAGGITGTIGLTGSQFNTLYDKTPTTHKNTLNTNVTLVVDAAGGSTTIEATVLADMNTVSTNVVNASTVTTVTGTASAIASVTSKMTAPSQEINLSGLTTLNPSDKVLATTFDVTVFTQTPVTINLANVADNAITSADGTVGAGNVLKIDGTLLDSAKVLTFDGHLELDGKFSVTGGAGSNVIVGGAGTDTIAGGAGSDTITGGAGSDAITDALGDDVYVFNTSDVVAGETLVDSAGTDTIKVVTDTNFTDLSTPTIRTAAGIEQLLITSGQTATFTGAQLTGQTIAVNATAGTKADLAIAVANTAINSFSGLTFTAVSVGGNSQNAFDTGTNAVTITVAAAGTADVTGTSLADTITASAAGSVTVNGGAGSDTITGGGASDSIDGGADDDNITGGVGSDTITGGAGSDVMIGGAGNDVYVFAGTAGIGAGDSITEAGTAGTDTLSVTLDTNFTTVTALGLANVEQLLITSTKIATFTGAQLTGQTIAVNATAGTKTDLAITVADTAINSFSGLTFTAVSVGGNLQNAFDTGTDAVTITVAGGTADVTGTSLADTITATAAGSVTINGGAGSDTITGGGASDSIDGGADDDNITGGAGEDIITGGAGTDIIAGGAGSDTITGGAGSDAITDASGDDVYVFNTSDVGVGETLVDTTGTDTIKVVTDTNFTDLSTATILTAAGIEQLLITSGQTATFKDAQLHNQAIKIAETTTGVTALAINVAASHTADFSTLDFTTGFTVGSAATTFTSGTDTVTITVEAAGTADVTGTSLADTITATEAGSVTINGGAGSDTITGGNAGDTFVIKSGADGQIITIHNFNGTNDTLSFFSGAILNVVMDDNDTNGEQLIEATNATNSATTTVKLTGLTQAQDTNLFNMASFNTLFAKTGRGGNDVISGTGGNDTITGGDGRDAFVVASTLKTGTPLSDSTTTAYDKITDFGKVTTAITTPQDLGDLTKFGAATVTSVGGGANADILDINLKQADDSTANTLIVNPDVSATDVASVVSGSTTITGVISGGLLTITGTDASMADTLAEWVAVAQVTGLADTVGDSVAFEFNGNTYVFAENGAVDVLVELTGVTGVTGLVLGAASTSAAVGDIFII